MGSKLNLQSLLQLTELAALTEEPSGEELAALVDEFYATAREADLGSMGESDGGVMTNLWQARTLICFSELSDA